MSSAQHAGGKPPSALVARLNWTRGITRLYLLLGVGGWLFYWFGVVPFEMIRASREAAQRAFEVGDRASWASLTADANYPAAWREILRELTDPWAALLFVGIPLVGYALLRLAISTVRWLIAGFRPQISGRRPMTAASPLPYLLPVLAIQPGSQPSTRPIERVYGTAFSIGGDLYLTAGHVAQAAVKAGDLWIGYLADGRMRAARASEHVIFDGHDLAVFRAEVPNTKALPWSGEELALVEDVQAGGYPFALDPETRTLRLRAFKGHIVSLIVGRQFSAKPWCYELSFACPEGLSGAPLWKLDGDHSVVSGVIVGTSRSGQGCAKPTAEGGRRALTRAWAIIMKNEYHMFLFRGSLFP